MRVVIQRVKYASVAVDGEVIGKIGPGLMVLFGVCGEDSEQTADFFAEKIIKLRIFADDKGKTNLSLQDTGGGILIVSQFTLYAGCRKGNRPSFTGAAAPDRAEELYRYFVEGCRKKIPNVETGSFGAHMDVELCNDGPFTICLDSRDFI